MENAWDAVSAALAESRRIDAAIKDHAAKIARLLPGRLRYVSDDVLTDLKNELRDFNIHTGKWKKR